MDYKKFKLIQQYNRVVLWNMYADKPITSPIKNQLKRVDEEIEELAEHLGNPDKIRFSHLVNILDDFGDIFVTAGYYDYMRNNGSTCSIYQYETSGIIDEIVESKEYSKLGEIIRPDNALKIVTNLALSSKLTEFDLVGATEEVMTSNFSKFIPYGANKMYNDAIEHFNKENIEYTVTESSKLYYVFKRSSDDKVIKPVQFRPPVLSNFILI